MKWYGTLIITILIGLGLETVARIVSWRMAYRARRQQMHVTDHAGIDGEGAPPPNSKNGKVRQ